MQLPRIVAHNELSDAATDLLPAIFYVDVEKRYEARHSREKSVTLLLFLKSKIMSHFNFTCFRKKEEK